MRHQALVQRGRYDDGVLRRLADEPVALELFLNANFPHDHGENRGVRGLLDDVRLLAGVEVLEQLLLVDAVGVRDQREEGAGVGVVLQDELHRRPDSDGRKRVQLFQVTWRNFKRIYHTIQATHVSLTIKITRKEPQKERINGE